MKIVLLSGGAGKRLWPLSNTTRSKQFLKILESDYKDTESMVERVWRQISRVDMSNSVYIATSKLQSEILQNQLGNNIKTIIEPDRRDTFPAIALAASYLYSKEQIDIEEVITILPIDFYVQDEFFDKIKELDTAINDSDADIGLIGVNPTYPSEKYGYVIPTQFQVCQDYSFVKYFIEKPSRHHAQKLIKQNALWNCGVFAFKLKKILSILQKKGIPLNFDEFIPYFSELPKVSFDYEVLEKASNTIVLPYRGEWKDLGSWDAITEDFHSNVLGKGTISTDSKNTHIINELEIPICVLGLSNISVVASPDGILVTNKKASYRIKELLDNIVERPMYEERRWGSYRVLEYKKTTTNCEVLTKHINIRANKNISYQYHNMRSETWTIIKGRGVFILDGKLSEVTVGDILKIPPKAKHAIKAISDLEFIEVQIGSKLIEEDITRISILWSEIEKHCCLLDL